jgi:hypothetical protein
VTPIEQQIEQMKALAERHYPDDPKEQSACYARLLEERVRTFAASLNRQGQEGE